MYTAKCIITTERLITFEKTDQLQSKIFSHFVLRLDNVTIASGNILKYKPIWSIMTPETNK